MVVDVSLAPDIEGREKRLIEKAKPPALPVGS